MAPNPTTFRFGPYTLDGGRCVLLRDTEVVRLGPKATEVLLCLVARAGEVVTKDELMVQVWPDTFVEEANLSVHVSAIRRVLAHDGTARIETVARRGYRFTGATTTTTPVAAPGSLAILPFRALRSTESADHIGIGLADALITRLSALGEILVRPTSAVIPYAQRTQEPALIARALACDLVLDGSWQRDGDDLRVSAQLVRGQDGAVMWASAIVEPFVRLFHVQEALAEQLAQPLALRVSERQRALLQKPATHDNAAYEAYLRGRYFWSKLTPLWLLKSRQAFESALALDPGFALAHAGLADTDIVLAMFGEAQPRPTLERARAEALRAIELDENLAEAHTALAFVHAFADWSAPSARERLRRGIQLQPRSAPARQWYALFLAMTGHFIEAMAEIMTAREIDPLSLTVHTTLGLQHYFGGSDEDLDAHRQAIELEPSFALGHWALGLAYSLRDEYDLAIAAQERAVALTDGCAAMRAVLARFCARGGQEERARAIVGELEPLVDEGRVSPFRMATVRSGLDEPDAAFAWLARGLAERDPWMVWLSIDPMMAELREDPRCDSIIEAVGFTLED